MPKLTVDGIEVEVPQGATVLQACEEAGVEIPRFCYHDRLSIAGNCRMCLVEMEKAPKPVASCAFPAGDGMVIKTDTDLVKKARNGVMEFLLANHPLDCPICDQGGECDLQDQSMAYGFDRGRFIENKRAVSDKHMGPLIKTIMTRCIHCTRCVRFSTEIAGVDEMGMLNRGENAEITTYLEKALASELSGNVIDLCPVGALTSKPYAFKSRPWELTKTESVDVMDAVGSNIRVDSRGSEVLRVLPRIHEDVNEEWIADKTRYACDGLKRQRLDRPFVRVDGKLKAASWAETFTAIRDKLSGMDGKKIGAIAGDLADVESMLALKDLMTGLGSPNIDCRQDGAKVGGGARAGHLFNTSIAGIEEADAILLVGTNPRWEAPLVNARIRKTWLATDIEVAGIGPRLDLTYDVDWIGAGPQTLQEVVDGKHPFAEVLKAAEKPMIIVGSGALARTDGARVLGAAKKIADSYGLVTEDWNGFNVLHRAASRVGGLEIGFLPGEGGLDTAGMLEAAGKGELEAVWLLGADELDTAAFENTFVIYQGHHGDKGAHAADVILPGAAYTEKNGTYVSTEGRVQRTRYSHLPLGDAREDWKILRAVSEPLGAKLPYDTIDQLQKRMIELNGALARLDHVAAGDWGDFGTDGAMDDAAFTLPIDNYYMTDPISRASQTMAACTEAFLAQTERTGTDG
ncbi:MAG: NADH-quinone oxidoreductase subunit NuoG [Alphaproteobacteria bacterium]|nr:NADH-quinone oxidoreductase subunit NuoG [Alphaproteobacteria bacterium]